MFFPVWGCPPGWVGWAHLAGRRGRRHGASMKYKILLIEGSPERADEIERPLVSTGYELLVCRSRDQVDEALPERPDLALIASEGQGEAVSDLCRAVRDAHASTPVVLLGGSAEESPGFDDYLKEPVTETALVALCARLLGPATIDPREETRQLEDAKAQNPAGQIDIRLGVALHQRSE